MENLGINMRDAESQKTVEPMSACLNAPGGKGAKHGGARRRGGRGPGPGLRPGNWAGGGRRAWHERGRRACQGHASEKNFGAGDIPSRSGSFGERGRGPREAQ